MSKFTRGSNTTCEYGANNAERVVNENNTDACTVKVFGANISAGQNITVDIDERISFLAVQNIPAAIAAASIATLIVVYLIVRRRRTE